MTYDVTTLLIIAATFVLAGFVKGAIGLGLPTVGMGLLGLVLPPAQAAALMTLPSTVTNGWQLLDGPALGRLVRRLWPMFAGVVVGTLMGSGWLAGGGHATVIGLGLALVVYAAVGLAKVKLWVPPRYEPVASPLVGLISGLLTAATGVFVIPVGPYLQALGLEKEELVQALGLSFMTSTVALAALLWRDGAFGGTSLGGSTLALVPALAGMAIGTVVRRRVSAETFRFWFFVGLLLLGSYIAASAIWRAM